MIAIPTDDLFPRDAAHRYRIYACRGSVFECLAATPTAAGIGVTILQFHEDAKAAGGEIGDRGQLGILDAVAGEWIVKPWNRPERPVTFGVQEIPIEV